MRILYEPPAGMLWGVTLMLVKLGLCTRTLGSLRMVVLSYLRFGSGNRPSRLASKIQKENFSMNSAVLGPPDIPA